MKTIRTSTLLLVTLVHLGLAPALWDKNTLSTAGEIGGIAASALFACVATNYLVRPDTQRMYEWQEKALQFDREVRTLWGYVPGADKLSPFAHFKNMKDGDTRWFAQEDNYNNTVKAGRIDITPEAAVFTKEVTGLVDAYVAKTKQNLCTPAQFTAFKAMRTSFTESCAKLFASNEEWKTQRTKKPLYTEEIFISEQDAKTTGGKWLTTYKTSREAWHEAQKERELADTQPTPELTNGNDTDTGITPDPKVMPRLILFASLAKQNSLENFFGAPYEIRADSMLREYDTLMNPVIVTRRICQAGFSIAGILAGAFVLYKGQ